MKLNYNKIFIIGNGVIAKALSVALALAGKNVTIIRGSVDLGEDHQETIEVETGAELLTADITVSTLNNCQDLEGLILLTNKSFGNLQLAEKLRGRAQHYPIVFLQNGLHIESRFLEFGFTELYRCVLFATSQSLTETKVRFKPVAASPIGVIKGSSEVLDYIVDQINTDNFGFRVENDIQTIVWKKVITNCVFNSICPLLEIDNGIFCRSEDALALAKTVIKECVAVATENGLELTEEDVLNNVLSISERSDGQKISTYQDILSGRQTEIETLNLAIERTAKTSGDLTVPITALLGKMTKIKADLFRK